MRPALLALTLGLVLSPSAFAGTPEPGARSGHPMVGAYSPASADLDLVQEARTFVQAHLQGLDLDEVCEAYTQVVAGLNIKFVCPVRGEDGLSRWQFVVYRSLDGRQHFTSAIRIP
ncbi:hypothetical protein [Mesoterricola sediminis]|uniref:Uncharacterized protein n=1 Tax=Mesoterricola sediminis TaxID=2927980 RepID=A0AA48KD52_9BACT|nr:hypothetical protein [Mesoterricola sediminis]BDU77884.1 hypothetical protein METESE_28420 [Mesoterricola sediminis]